MRLYRDYRGGCDGDLYYYVDQNGGYWEFLDELQPMLLLDHSEELRDRPMGSVMFEDAPEWVRSYLNLLIELGYVVID